MPNKSKTTQLRQTTIRIRVFVRTIDEETKVMTTKYNYYFAYLSTFVHRRTAAWSDIGAMLIHPIHHLFSSNKNALNTAEQ